MRWSWVLVVSLFVIGGCSSDSETPRQEASSLVVTDNASEITAESLQRFQWRGKSAVATVLGLGADVTVLANGQTRLMPTPVTDPSGRDVTPGWRYETSLAQVGRAGEESELGSPSGFVRTADGAIEQQYSDATVRYAHRGIGLKQDVIVKRRPAGEGEVEVAFDVSGPVELRQGDEAIDVFYSDRPVMRWTQLEVFDATDRTLRARMLVRGDKLVIRYDDADANYPVTVDPLAVTPLWNPDRSGGASNKNFGFKVRWAGDVDNDGFDDILVSEPLGRVNFVNEGRVYLFRSPNGVPNPLAAAALAGGEENAFFGQAIAAAGDVDQDGFADVAVGANRARDTVDNEGVVYMFRGQAAPDALNSSAAWTQGSGQEGSSFGATLDSGDFNCDGRTDLIVGAGFWDEGTDTRIGKAWIYFADGTADYYGATPWEQLGPSADSRFGSLVANAGNVNGDENAGYSCDDPIVAAANYSPSASLGSAGRVELFAGGSAGPMGPPLFTMDGTQESQFLGSAITSLGDANGDGYDDVAFGVQRWDDGRTDSGAVFVHLGDPSDGLVMAPQLTLNGPSADARLGFAVASGDVNGDGFGDLVASAPLADVTANGNEGQVVVHVGSMGSGIDSQAAWEATGPEIDSRFGFSVHGRGDVDADGFDDVLIGAPLVDSNGVTNAGTVYVYRGGRTCRIGGAVFPAGTLNPNNPCESCDVANPTEWTVASDGSACTDDSVCGSNPTCQAGVCTGSGTTCDDSDPCTIDTCDSSGTCQFAAEPDGAICGTDPDPCVTLTCSSGACTPERFPSSCSIGGVCYTDGAVNPTNPCEVCDPSSSTTDWSQAAEGTTCNDGLFCTVGETCNASGECGGGAPRDCDGAVDTCNDDPFCSEGEKRCRGRATNEGGSCDDEDPCTENDVCSAGLCVGTALACGDLDTECATGTCNSATGTCETTPVTDGTGCGVSEGEACFGGECLEPIPEAQIAGDTTVACDDTIELDGTGSSDARSLPLTFEWRQIAPESPDVIGGSPTDGQFLQVTNDGQFSSETTVTFGLVVDNGFNPSIEVTQDVTFAGCTMMEDADPSDMGGSADAGTDMGSSMDAGMESDLGMDGGPAGPSGSLSGSGCGCASGDGAPVDALPALVLLGFVAWRARRRTIR